MSILPTELRQAALLSALVLLPFEMSAQSPAARGAVSIRPTESCAACRVELILRTTLGSPADTLLLRPAPRLDVDSRGWVYVGPTFGPSQIAVFDPDGQLRFGLGRTGQGPGELRAVNLIQVTAGDSVVVFDAGAARMVVYTPLREAARSEVLPGVGDQGVVIRLRAGEVVGYNTSTADAWVVDRHGNESAQFSLSGAASGNHYSRLRTLASAADQGEVWVARRNAYELELWSATGQRKRVLKRDVSWFPQWSLLPRGVPGRARTPPDMLGVWQESRERLWVFIRVPSETWKPAKEGERVGINQYDEYIDTMVEVVNPQTGELIASDRVPGVVWLVPDKGMVYRWSTNADGVLVIRLFSLRLQPIPDR